MVSSDKREKPQQENHKHKTVIKVEIMDHQNGKTLLPPVVRVTSQSTTTARPRSTTTDRPRSTTTARPRSATITLTPENTCSIKRSKLRSSSFSTDKNPRSSLSPAKPSPASFSKNQRARRSSSPQRGQSSNSKPNPGFVCELCVETKALTKLFPVKGCSHAYCDDCVARYVTSKVEENVTLISCPVSDCKGSLDPEYCRKILPENVFDRWGKALCETLIVGAQKFYCPFKDCSALLVNDGEEAVREAECPYCHRLFCAQCKVAWHSGMECVEFQKLDKNEREREDIMLMKLARKKKWQRCPNCKYYVEKRDGCLYMKCRCSTAFCYNCGNPADEFNNAHHYCGKCRR